MLRYVCFIWNAADHGSASVAQLLANQVRRALPDMQHTYSAAGMSVYFEAPRTSAFSTYPVGHRHGVVLGKLFPREMDEEANPPPVSLSGESGTSIVRSEGRQIVDCFWGQYIAFLNDGSGTSRVIRDPTGAIPCHSTSHRQVEIFFSHMHDCLSLGITNFSINWKYVTARMVLQFVDGNETGLNEVSLVSPGECRVVRPGTPARSSFYWDPVEIARSNPIEDLETASREARKTVRACVGAWASGYPRIVQRLSGGLDSSILLECLRRAPSRPELTCINHFERSAWGDERRFARLAWEGARRDTATPGELIEQERRPEDVRLNEIMANALRTAAPTAYVTAHELRRLDIPVATRDRAAVFTGTHGDGVFFTRKTYSAADYFHRHGFSGELLRVAHATAHSAGIPVWKVLYESIRSGFQARRNPYSITEDLRKRMKGCRFITAVVLEELAADGERYVTPFWLNETDRLAPGKVCHLKLMSLPLDVTNPFRHPGDPDWIMPFASQPIVELFSRIPSYVLTEGGRNRAVVREAFAGDLPPQILARQSKGFGNHLLLDIFRHNAQIYRETLLDGVLVSEKLLDRRKVAAFFSATHDAGTKGIVELLQSHFNLEIWLRSWKAAAAGKIGAAA